MLAHHVDATPSESRPARVPAPDPARGAGPVRPTISLQAPAAFDTVRPSRIYRNPGCNALNSNILRTASPRYALTIT